MYTAMNIIFLRDYQRQHMLRQTNQWTHESVQTVTIKTLDSTRRFNYKQTSTTITNLTLTH